MSNGDILPFARPANDTASCVWYDIAVCHYATGVIEVWCKGVDTDHPHTRQSAVDALRTAANLYDPPVTTESTIS